MSIRDRAEIPVYNYNETNLFIKTNIKTYKFEPAKEEPSMIYLSFPEIVYVNSRENCFKTGYVRFAKEDEEEIYKELGIRDWKNIITTEEIEKILRKPTAKGLTKLISITDPAIFDRIRTIFVRLKESFDSDISNRLTKVIEARGLELKRGIYDTGIVIRFRDSENDEEIEKQLKEVEQKNAEMEKQIEELKKQLAESNKVKTETTTTTKSTATTKSTKK